MRVNHSIRSEPQPTLWPGADDTPVKSAAQVRNIAGDFAEEATAVLLGGRRITTRGDYDVCPDVIVTPGLYAESKSVGRSNSVIVYKGRHEKDQAWVKEHNAQLWYFIWRHGADSKVASRDEMRRNMAVSIQSCLIVSLVEMTRILHSRPVRVLNTKYATRKGDPLGYGNRSKGYGIGWCLPLSIFLRTQTIEHDSLEVYRLKLPPFRLECAEGESLPLSAWDGKLRMRDKWELT